MDAGWLAEEDLFLSNSLRQQLCWRDGNDATVLRAPDGHSSSTAFTYIPTIHSVGINALNPTHDPIYRGSLPARGDHISGREVGPIQPPKRDEDMWLQVCRYGEGIALEDLADYIMDQRPPHPYGRQPNETVPKGRIAFAQEYPFRRGPFWVVVDPCVAVATIDKILKLHLLHCNTSKCEVEALVDYYIRSCVDERKLSLPYLPNFERGLLCFWEPKQKYL